MQDNGKLRVIRSQFLTDKERGELEDAPVLDPDTLDAAIIGSMVNASNERLLVYSYEKLVEVFAEDYRNDPVDEELDEDDEESTPEFKAREWVDSNTVPALAYYGSRAPLVLVPLDGGADVAEDLDPSEIRERSGYARASPDQFLVNFQAFL